MKKDLKNFVPLIIIFSIICIVTGIKQYCIPNNFNSCMADFMGAFFIVFGCFKIINLSGFAYAYAMYDIIAKRSMFYAMSYPFIELFLGVAYLLHYHFVNWITLPLMLINSIGVSQKLFSHEQIECACLGAVFKIPMTYVTLAEDLLMAFMALIMLFY